MYIYTYIHTYTYVCNVDSAAPRGGQDALPPGSEHTAGHVWLYYIILYA